MNREEYAIMAQVEGLHWWYQGLREMINLHWTRWGQADARIVDVGCGTGANAAMVECYGSVFCVDYSKVALDLCRANHRLLRQAQAALPHLPLRDETFEVALLMDVLYHRAVPDKLAALREMYRILEPGGALLLNVPAYEWLRSSHDRAIHTDHRFTRGEINGLLKEAGFTIERSTYWNTILFPAVAAVRLLRKSSDTGTSDLDGYTPGFSATIFRGLLRIERACMRMFPLPFGLSIFVAARKPG